MFEERRSSLATPHGIPDSRASTQTHSACSPHIVTSSAAKRANFRDGENGFGARRASNSWAMTIHGDDLFSVTPTGGRGGSQSLWVLSNTGTGHWAPTQLSGGAADSAKKSRNLSPPPSPGRGDCQFRLSRSSFIGLGRLREAEDLLLAAFEQNRAIKTPQNAALCHFYWGKLRGNKQGGRKRLLRGSRR